MAKALLAVAGWFIVSPLLFHLFLVNGETSLQVVWQGSRMVLGVGVKPQALGAVAPGFFDRPLKEIPAQAFADELRSQSELNNLNHAFDTPIKLDKPRWDALERYNQILWIGE
jgi:hypothetical protein